MPPPLRLRVRQAMAAEFWDDVVGPQVAAATRIDAIRNGVITVRTRSGPWAQDVALHASLIVERLNERLGGRLIEKLVFHAYGIEAPEEAAAADPTVEELALQGLTADQEAALAAGIQALPPDIPEGWREGAVRVMRASARLWAWRLEHGWQVCPGCGSLARLEGSLCRACVLAAEPSGTTAGRMPAVPGSSGAGGGTGDEGG